MKNHNKKRCIFALTLFFVAVSMLSIDYSVKNEEGQGIVVSKDESEGPINLNASEIKMKNVGDTFILKANVNYNASFKRLVFSSSDDSKIAVSENTDSSCKLTKLCDFTELVYINIETADPFDDFQAQVKVRGYNRILNMNLELEWICMLDGNEVYNETDREVVFLDGASYSFIWHVETLFSGCKNVDYYENTYTSIEDEDFEYLKQQIEEVFQNPISNVAIDESLDAYASTITFDMDYENDLFLDSNYFEVNLSMYKTSTIWLFKKYIPISSVDIDGDLIVL